MFKKNNLLDKLQKKNQMMILGIFNKMIKALHRISTPLLLPHLLIHLHLNRQTLLHNHLPHLIQIQTNPK